MILSEVDKDWRKTGAMRNQPYNLPSCARTAFPWSIRNSILEIVITIIRSSSDCMCLFYWNIPCVHVQQRWSRAAVPSFISVIASLAAGEQLLSQPELCPDINRAVKLQDTPNHTDCGQDLSHSRGSPLVKPLCERLQQLTAADAEAGWFRVDNRTRPQPERFTK